MNRGRARQDVFADDRDYEAFLETVGEAVERFGLDVHAYCLMPNHYHLLVCTPRGNLGRVMRHIDGLYTQRYNRRHGIDGPLFRGRYRAILIGADAWLLSVSSYIHRNPADGVQPLVNELDAWRWSSFPAFVGRVQRTADPMSHTPATSASPEQPGHLRLPAKSQGRPLIFLQLTLSNVQWALTTGGVRCRGQDGHA